MFGLSEPFLAFEYPGLVPEVVPYRKERRGDELADSWVNADILKAEQYQIVQQERVECRVNDISTGCHPKFRLTLRFKYPVTFYKEVQRQSDRITDKISPKQTDMVIQQHDKDVAAPEPHPTTYQVFPESGQFFLLLSTDFEFHVAFAFRSVYQVCSARCYNYFHR